MSADNEIKIPPRAGRVKCADGTMDQPGRNHPGLGTWLVDFVAKPGTVPVYVADPFCGAGFLWQLVTPHVAEVFGCDLRAEAVALARKNSICASIDDARKWSPNHRVDLVAFSPPYPNCNHSSGKNEKQIAMRMKKHLKAMETCPGTWNLLPVFLQVATYCRSAPVAVIVRNWIERGQEVDWVSEVEQSMRFAGFATERKWRRILPGPTTQWKLKSGKQTAWVAREWVLVGRRDE